MKLTFYVYVAGEAFVQGFGHYFKNIHLCVGLSFMASNNTYQLDPGPLDPSVLTEQLTRYMDRK